MKNNADFVNFLFEIVNRETLIDGIHFCNDKTIIGSRPSCYLMGGLGQIVTKDLLEYEYNRYYTDIKKDKFDNLTKNWVREKRQMFDCQGVLDYFCGIDINASMNYNSYCTITGENAIALIMSNPSKYRGAAFFKKSANGKIHHVGFFAGIANNGDWLIIEAKGLYYGVVMSRYDPKDWALCGIPDKLLSFDELKEIKLIVDNEIVYHNFI